MFVLTRRRKIATLVVVDSLLLIAANIAAAKFMKPFVAIPMDLILISIGLSIGFYLFYGSLFKVFTRINRYTNLREIIAIFSSLSASAASSILILLFINRRYSLRLVIFAYLLSLLLIIGSRLIWRIYIETKNMRYVLADSAKNTLIVGAGEGGRILYNSFLGSKTAQDIHVVGFVDDDPNKRNTYLSGKKVLGALKDIPELIEKYDIQMVTIAIPSLSRKRLRRIFELVESARVKVNTMPSIEELASGKISVSKLKTIDVVDLLGRDEVKLDIESIKDQITDKVILVTGAGGSIGSEICRQIIQFNPAKLLLLGHGENSIYLIDRELRTHHQNCPTEIVPIIADIQDREKINEIMEQYHPDIVYHAAAHKHVSLMEYNPKEAVKNNIFGTKYDLIEERDKYHANDIRPGLTGLAQISGRNELEIDYKARLDGQYTANITPWMDLKCFFGTIISVFKSEGVVEGGTGSVKKEDAK
ncbi:polysaccharide biosynthesis protein [Enterococcus faecium]|nr:polysaccharide biosynthesis protein [Enterococcus faecium]